MIITYHWKIETDEMLVKRISMRFLFSTFPWLGEEETQSLAHLPTNYLLQVIFWNIDANDHDCEFSLHVGVPQDDYRGTPP